MADDASQKPPPDGIDKPPRPSAGATPQPAAADTEATIAQHDIESLLTKGGSSTKLAPRPRSTDDDAARSASHEHAEMHAGARAGAGSSTRAGAPADSSGQSDVAPEDIELLLRHAEAALASVDRPSDEAPPNVRPFELEHFSGAPPSAEAATIELIRDVELDVKIELGRTHMFLQDVLKLRKGAVVPLDKLAGDPVDIFVNGRLVARGEVLVLNDNFCVRVAELVAGEPTVVK